MSFKGLIGSEATLRLVKDGKPMEGSFLEVENWKLDPEAEIMKADIIGEKFAKHRLRVDGWSFSFSVLNPTDDSMKLWIELVEAYEDNEEAPNIDVVVTERFVNPAVGTKTYVLGAATMMMNSHGGDRKEFVKDDWTGYAQRLRAVQ